MTEKLIAVRAPLSLLDRYSHLAKITGRTKSYYIRKALSDSIDKLEYEYTLLKDVEDYRSGDLKTYSLDDVGEKFDLDD